MPKKDSNVHLNFSNESLEKIRKDNLNCKQIKQLLKEQDKDKNIKGLTYPKIRAALWDSGFKFDDTNNKWITLTEEEKDSPVNPYKEVPDSNKCHRKNTKQIDELSKRITNMESLTKEILLKISEIESELKDKGENSLSKNYSNASLKIQQFVELNYSNGKRYEVTLREDFVNKAKEKLKSRYTLESVDLSKLSNLFEIILYDYINSDR